MDRLLILLCAMAPSIVFLQYGVAKAHGTWDDALIWNAFFAGGVSAALVFLPELALKELLAVKAMSPLHGAATDALVITAIPEEIAKFAALFYAVRRYGGDAVRHDMITLSLAVALGFAAIENLAYLVAPGDWQHLAFDRALTAVPGHGIDGLAMGASITAARLYDRRRALWLAAALAVPILLHAGYDFPLMLVERNRALYGVLPAWFLMSILATIGVLYFCNSVRAAAVAADHRAGRMQDRPERSWSPQRTGIAMLLFIPLLAVVKLILNGQFGIVDASAVGMLPAIFGIDLLCTGPRSLRSAPYRSASF